MATAAYLLLIPFIGSFLQSVVGFGFSIFVMAFLPRLFPLSTAIAVNLALAMANNIVVTVKYRKNIRWRVLLPVMIPSLAIGSLATVASLSVDTKNLTILLGIFLMVLSVYFFFSERIHIHPTVAGGVALGLVSGLCGGFFGIGGPPIVLYMLPAIGEDDKIGYIASMQIYFLFSNMLFLSLRIAHGSVTASILPCLGIGLIGVALGVVGGLFALARIPQKAFRKCVYVFIGLNGLWIVFENALGV